MTEIALTEEFNNTRGQYTNYDAYDIASRAIVRNQKHVDIRVFENGNTSTPQTVVGLSVENNTTLAAQTMSQVQGAQVIKRGEGWTSGTVGKQADRRNLRGISLPLTSGTTTTTSISDPIDLLTGFDDNDFISVALAALPAAVTLASSYVDFTSNSAGDFTAGPTASVPFSSSSPAVTTGNTELRVLRSALSGIDLANVTGVRFRIASTGVATFRALAIRLLSKDWTYITTDQDTVYGQLRATVPPNADTTVSGGTPISMWRASDLPGEDDPRPIDGEVGIIFNTGSMTSGNNVKYYFRELTEDFMQMLDLNSLPMASFDGAVMPDVGQARYNGRSFDEIDLFDQNQLDEQTQFTLERTPDSLSASWVSFTVQWGTTNSVTIGNSEGGAYTFAVTGLTANTTYAIFASLEDTAAQLAIYALDSAGTVGTKIFDSMTIDDNFTFKRRKGRVGWSATLGDGDSYIEAIRDRGSTYGEYRSLPYESFTPIVGAELFATATPPTELVSTMAPGPFNGESTKVTTDSSRTTTDQSYRVQILGDRPMQGVQSDSFNLSDFANNRLTFDIYYPSGAGSLIAFLLSGSRTVALTLPTIKYDQWNSVKVNFPFGQNLLSDQYRIILMQPEAVAATWWIDNVHMYKRSVVWDARGSRENPWHSNPPRWTPFFENHSKENAGVLFERRGKHLQVRAKARRQHVSISRIQFKPKYAELGRLIWSGDQQTRLTLPTGGFTSASTGTRSVKLTSTATDSDGFIANVEWNFGDGSVAIGNVVNHTYTVAGTYTVTMIITDNNGNRSTYSNTVGV